METTEIFIGIIIFIVIVGFIVVVLVAVYATSPVNVTPNPNYQTGRFLSPCSGSNCNDGFVCDGVSYTCRLPEGALCTDYSDCVTGLICSGRCTSGSTGGVGQSCPCAPGYTCILNQSTGYATCLGTGGTSCQDGSECVSGVCDNFVCTVGAPNGYPCAQDSNCTSGNCSYLGDVGYCQAESIGSGTVGAACNVSPCGGFTGGVQGAPCTSTTTQPLTCSCSTPGVAGICITQGQGVLATCSSTSACVNNLICYGPTAAACVDTDTNCECLFNYNNPNVPVSGSCIQGTQAVGNLCLNDSGLGCGTNLECASGTCSGSGMLTYYRFTDLNSSLLGAAFPGATNTSILSAFPGPTFSGTSIPYKMIGTSNGPTDTLYVIDHAQGFLSLEYTPSTGTSSGWTQLIPAVQTIGVSTLTLIDVGYNGSTFLAAFSEEGTIGTFDTVYTWTSTGGLAVYNFQPGSGLPGTQYESGTNRPLEIDFIDISSGNDISPPGYVIISGGTGGTTGNVYLQNADTDAKYSVTPITGGSNSGSLMRNTEGPARFYYDNITNPGGTGPIICGATAGSENPIVQCSDQLNIAFVGNFSSFGSSTVIPSVLQFSGNIAGIGIPLDQFGTVTYRVFDYDIYSPNPGGMSESSIIMLTSMYSGSTFLQNVVSASYNGAVGILPYNIDATARSAATQNGYYILSRGTCA